MSELPRGTVTFLFTDIEGSTELLKTLGGEQYHQVLADHQQLLRSAFGDVGGREIDTQGDSFFFAFPKAQDGVAAAVAGQRALTAHAWPDGTSLRVRMGLDTGEPIVGTDRYVGLGVHRTARIMAAGHGGQVLVSATTRQLVEDDLPPGITLRDLGEQRLKDLDRPVRLFQVVAPGLPSKFPRLRTLESGAARLRRKRVVLPVAAAAVAAIAALVLVVGRSDGGGLTVSPNSVGVIDPSTNKVVGQIPVGIRPGGIDVRAGSVWVANVEDKTLSRIDAKTRVRTKEVPLGATPTGVAVGQRAVWAAEGLVGSLARIHPLFYTVQTIEGVSGHVSRTGSPAGSTAVGAGSVWAAYGNSTVARVRPATNRVIARGFAGVQPSGIAVGDGFVWIANAGDNTVSQLSPVTNTTVFTISVGEGPSGVTVGGGAVWVADTADGAVTRIDPGSRSTTTIPVGRGPIGISYGAGAVWVANSKDGTVSRIDPAAREVVETIRVGSRPVGIAAGGGAVWVTVDSL